MRKPRGSAGSEEGSGTVLVLVAAAVLLGVGAVALTGAQLVGARRSLTTAADLVAVAAAATPGDDAVRCGTAAEIARANGAALDRCDVAPDATVRVTVSRALRLPLARVAGAVPRRLTAAARAGVVGGVSDRAAGP